MFTWIEIVRFRVDGLVDKNYCLTDSKILQIGSEDRTEYIAVII
jgi:hypothetical protein